MSLQLGGEGEQRFPLLMSATNEEGAGPPSALQRREELSRAPSGPVPAQELEPGIDMEDVMYSANSFSAVMKPVALTMFLARYVRLFVPTFSAEVIPLTVCMVTIIDFHSIVVVNVDYGEATGSDGQSMRYVGASTVLEIHHHVTSPLAKALCAAPAVCSDGYGCNLYESFWIRRLKAHFCRSTVCTR